MESLIPWKDLDANPLATAQKMDMSMLAHVLESSEEAYYNHGDSALSDRSYDIIKEYVDSQQQESLLPQRIGAPVDSSSISDRKCKLPVYMGSLNKITESHASTLKTFVTKYADEYVVSDKLDGNSALLVLRKNDTSAQMFTRGNGFEGLDVSHIVSTMLPNLDKEIWSNVADPTLTTILIRGEVILTRKAFSDSLRHKGGATARNMIAGMLNSKIPDPEILAASDFVAYEVIEPVLRPSDQIEFLDRLGVRHAHSEVWSSCDTLTFAELQKHLRKRTQLSEYEIDGLVIVHNAIHARDVGQNPRYAFAFKDCEALQRENVTVRFVEWKLSKDGRYVPTIHFDAVTIDNVSIQRATGFNAKFIVDHGIGPGARAVIVRAGAVIPHVTQVLAASPTGPQLPEGNDTVWSQSGVDLLLRPVETLDSTIPQILAKKLLHHFFDKIGVMGLGPALTDRLYDAGLNKVDVIAQATVDDLCQVPGVKVTLARKLHASIQTSISDLNVLMLMEACNAFGRGFGSKKLEILMKAVHDGQGGQRQVTEDVLCEIKGIDRLTARAFIEGLERFDVFCESNPFIWSRVQRQQNTKSERPIKTNDAVTNKRSYVFSGFRDRDLEARFSGNDAIAFENTVSRNTFAVIVASIDDVNDTTKTRRARDLGIPIIDVQHFLTRHGGAARA